MGRGRALTDVYAETQVSASPEVAHNQIVRWLAAYRGTTVGGRLTSSATVRLGVDNEVQPGVLRRLDPAQRHIPDQ